MTRTCGLHVQHANDELDAKTATLWFAGKQLLPKNQLSHHLGRHEKTKAVVKLQQAGQGAPGREPVSISPTVYSVCLQSCVLPAVCLKACAEGLWLATCVTGKLSWACCCASPWSVPQDETRLSHQVKCSKHNFDIVAAC